MALMLRVRATVVLLASLLAASCLIEGPILLPYEGMQPEEISDGWKVSTPAAEGFDRDALERIYKDVHGGDLWQMRSLLVLRHGNLVAESYLKDKRDIRTQRAIWSATKQVVGVLVGIAIERGKLESVQERLADCLTEIPERYPDKAEITLENILEMRSAIAFSNDGAAGQTSQMLRKIPADSLDFILSLPMQGEPGLVSDYHDGNPHLLSLCIQRRTGKPLDTWAKGALFNDIGFKNYTWERYRDGSTLGAFGILTTPRELAKVAQLVLDKGEWHGKRIVSEAWIDEMTAPRVDSYDERYSFGYQWWRHDRLDASYMNGHGGQYAFIDWPTETLVVMTAEPNTQGDHQIAEHQAAAIFESVLDAIEDTPP